MAKRIDLSKLSKTESKLLETANLAVVGQTQEYAICARDHAMWREVMDGGRTTYKYNLQVAAYDVTSDDEYPWPVRIAIPGWETMSREAAVDITNEAMVEVADKKRYLQLVREAKKAKQWPKGAGAQAEWEAKFLVDYAEYMAEYWRAKAAERAEDEDEGVVEAEETLPVYHALPVDDVDGVDALDITPDFYDLDCQVCGTEFKVWLDTPETLCQGCLWEIKQLEAEAAAVAAAKAEAEANDIMDDIKRGWGWKDEYPKAMAMLIANLDMWDFLDEVERDEGRGAAEAYMISWEAELTYEEELVEAS